MLLNRTNLSQIYENINIYTIDDCIWLHFPVTKELTKGKIISIDDNRALIHITEDSDYFGCPDFYIEIYNIIGKIQ